MFSGWKIGDYFESSAISENLQDLDRRIIILGFSFHMLENG
jgi:hypothetical protein